MKNPTLALLLCAFKQGKFCWVVHHRELPEQCLDDFSDSSFGADVQVLRRVLGEVERCPPLYPSVLLILLFCRVLALRRRRRERDGTKELKVDLDETGVGPIFVLQVSRAKMRVKGSYRSLTKR